MRKRPAAQSGTPPAFQERARDGCRHIIRTCRERLIAPSARHRGPDPVDRTDVCREPFRPQPRFPPAFRSMFHPPGEQAPRVKVEVVLGADRSEEHTSELQSLMRISYAD